MITPGYTAYSDCAISCAHDGARVRIESHANGDLIAGLGMSPDRARLLAAELLVIADACDETAVSKAFVSKRSRKLRAKSDAAGAR